MFSLYIWSQDDEATFELKLATSQAVDMTATILDYINAIAADAADAANAGSSEFYEFGW